MAMVQAERRWDFLAPWCAALKGRIEYSSLECEENYIDTVKRYLQVTPPSRTEVAEEGGDENEPSNDNDFPLPSEYNFQLKLQRVREALALLAAVAHLDDKGWKYLLSTYCGVTLGVEGEERREKKLPAEFVLFLDMEGEHVKEGELDLVHFCGVHQRTSPSVEYLNALVMVAAVGDNLLVQIRGADVFIPVKVHASICLNKSASGLAAALAQIQREERMVKEQWADYEQQVGMTPVTAGLIRCTFVLEPIIVDFSGCTIAVETAKAMQTLVRANVRASEVSIGLTMSDTLENRPGESRQVFCQLMTSAFDGTRRPYENTKYHSGFKKGSDVANSFQFGMIHLECDIKLFELDMPALFSAIAVTQTTTDFSIQIMSKIYQEPEGVQFWKWVAYAFFSRRASVRSSIESLTVTDVGLLSLAEVEGFTAVMASKHPEEELFGVKLGKASGKEATLNAGAPIKWQFDTQGHVLPNSETLVFDSPIRFVRTFGDSGRSKWVNVLIPGLGRGFVQRSDLVFSQQNSRKKLPPSKVKAFTIRFHGFMMWRRPDHLQELLKSMGPQLTFLKVVCPADSMDANLIVQRCPHLQTMELWRGHCNVVYDFRGFHEQNQPLSALNFDGWTYNALTDDLSDPSNPQIWPIRRVLAHRLNPTDFGTVVYDPRINDEIRAYLDMLDVNKTIEFLSVSLSTPFHHFLPAFRKHHLEPIERVAKYPTACKIAFLSVVFSDPAPTNANKKQEFVAHFVAARAIWKLSQSMICTIFSFARSFAVREVYALLIKDGVPLGMPDDEDFGEDFK